MSVEGVDYSWDRPDPTALYAAGKRFACRYASHNTTGKNLTLSEAKRLRAAGLYVVSNWESVPDIALRGRAQGVADARDALAQHRAAGMPSRRPIYFSADFDVQPSQMAAVAAYLDGCASEIGRDIIGVYGGYDTCYYMWLHNHATWIWQTYAWSGGRVFPSNNLYQYSNGHTIGGGRVDYDRAMTADYGGWAPGGPSGPTGEVPIGSPGTDNAWDYTPTISGLATDLVGLGSTMNSSASAINALRK